MSEEDKVKQAFRRGVEFEKKYHGCAQCTIAALYSIFPELRNDAVFRSASGLATGVGLTGEGHCGGLTGGVMVLSQIYGRELDKIADPERKREHAFRLGEKMVQKFLDEYNTVICREIQTKLMGRSFDLWDPEQKKQFEAAGGHEWACTTVIGKSVQWTTALILAERRKEIGRSKSSATD
jgi:C_GCAxxG_C_C family probable redox protein